ncbi:MAG: PilZ domain-containing protein [Pseudomonadota bacterium]
MTDNSDVGDRISLRRRVIKGGTIAFNKRRLTYSCVVRDISESGARLKVNGADGIPDTFDLLIELDGFEAECEVVWRDGDQIGIQFLSPPLLTAPKRKQVIVSPDRAPIASVRLADRRRRPVRIADAGTDLVEPPLLDEVEAPAAPVTDQDSEIGLPEDADESPSEALFADETPRAEPVGVIETTLPLGPHVLIFQRDADFNAAIGRAFEGRDNAPAVDFVRDADEFASRFDLAGQAGVLGPRPGIVVVDLEDGGEEAVEALRILCNREPFSQIPVIAMASNDEAPALDETLDRRIGLSVAKPQSPETCENLVRTLVRFWNNFVAPSAEAASGPVVEQTTARRA